MRKLLIIAMEVMLQNRNTQNQLNVMVRFYTKYNKERTVNFKVIIEFFT